MSCLIQHTPVASLGWNTHWLVPLQHKELQWKWRVLEALHCSLLTLSTMWCVTFCMWKVQVLLLLLLLLLIINDQIGADQLDPGFSFHFPKQGKRSILDGGMCSLRWYYFLFYNTLLVPVAHNKPILYSLIRGSACFPDACLSVGLSICCVTMLGDIQTASPEQNQIQFSSNTSFLTLWTLSLYWVYSPPTIYSFYIFMWGFSLR